MTVSYEEAKNRQIAVSVGIQAAVAIAAADKDNRPIDTFNEIVEHVVDVAVTLQDKHRIQDAFPGTTDVTATYVPNTTATQPAGPPPQAQFVPQPQQAYVPPPQAPAQPAPVPGATDGDPAVAALWQQLLADPSKFWDNRTGKKNPKAPDFKSKANGDNALWISDKKNPSWVLPALQQRGLA